MAMDALTKILLAFALILLVAGLAGRMMQSRRRVVAYDNGDPEESETLFSEIIPLKGTPDEIRRSKKGGLIVIERKSRRAPRHRVVWPGHDLQVAAYARLVEENYGEHVAFALVEYEDATRKVTLNEKLSARVEDMVMTLKKEKPRNRWMRPMQVSPKKCANCGVREFCKFRADLPDAEEEEEE
ncbi:MAG: PD-(D/E)XK nuclease family protein [Blastocatellia bacterium]